MTEEHKNKISLANKGKKRTLLFKQKQKERMLGKKHSVETKKKMSLAHIGINAGEKRWNWKGGITPIHQKIRGSTQYKLWKRSVLERDNYTCIWCACKEKQLHADHIKSFCDYPELRFAIDNGRTLCIDCHKTTTTWGVNKK